MRPKTLLAIAITLALAVTTLSCPEIGIADPIVKDHAWSAVEAAQVVYENSEDGVIVQRFNSLIERHLQAMEATGKLTELDDEKVHAIRDTLDMIVDNLDDSAVVRQSALSIQALLETINEYEQPTEEDLENLPLVGEDEPEPNE